MTVDGWCVIVDGGCVAVDGRSVIVNVCDRGGGVMAGCRGHSPVAGYAAGSVVRRGRSFDRGGETKQDRAAQQDNKEHGPELGLRFPGQRRRPRINAYD